MVDDRHRKHLLSVARDAIARHTGVSSLPPPPAPDPDLPPGRSVFVTLSTGGRLRGCVGHLEPRGSLDEIVASCAVAAATADPRFPPLEPAELAHVTIEISLLNPPIPVAGPEDIVVGTHGIIVRKGARRGLLLPQVAAEYRWPAETLLDQAALKAGLPQEGWRAGASLEVFTAEVFSEADVAAPRGA